MTIEKTYIIGLDGLNLSYIEKMNYYYIFITTLNRVKVKHVLEDFNINGFDMAIGFLHWQIGKSAKPEWLKEDDVIYFKS